MSEIVRQFEFFDVYRADRPPGRKTDVFTLVNRNSSHPIGVVRWYGAWRQYVLFPEAETIWSGGCLEEVAEFLAELKEARRGG